MRSISILDCDYSVLSITNQIEIVIGIIFLKIGRYDKALWERTIEQKEIKVLKVSQVPKLYTAYNWFGTLLEQGDMYGAKEIQDASNCSIFSYFHIGSGWAKWKAQIQTWNTCWKSMTNEWDL